MSDQYDVIVVGGGPGGLAAAQVVAQSGRSVLVLEQNGEIGSPTRTTGCSMIQDLQSLGIPDRLYHPFRRGRFLSPHNNACFEYGRPLACLLDVRGLFQFLAEQAIQAGARMRLGTTALDAILCDDYVAGVRARGPRNQELDLRGRIVVDAGGYRSVISKRAGIHAGFRRFGVGAEYDLYAPAYDQEEAVAIVGSRIAPGGYAWAAPWGNHRVRLGVGVIHADSKANPADYLDKLVREASTFGMNLNGAEPVEYHYGLIPSDGLAKRFVGNGIMAVGDAAGQASTLLGEGIRWAIMAGRSAGRVAADALAANDYSAGFLGRYEKQWRARHGANLRLAHIFNRRIARWEDDTWDEAVELIKLLTPEQFAQALATNFVAPWVVSALARHPRLAFKGSALVMSQLAADSRRRSRN